MAEKLEVVKVVVEKDGEFLVVKERRSGKWELPGGIIEKDEDRFEAAERELEEETGLEGEKFEDVVRVEVEDRECVNCYIVYIETEGDEVELDEEELVDFEWIEPSTYREMDWHADGGYGVPAMVYLEEYLELDKNY